MLWSNGTLEACIEFESSVCSGQGERVWAKPDGGWVLVVGFCHQWHFSKNPAFKDVFFSWECGCRDGWGRQRGEGECQQLGAACGQQGRWENPPRINQDFRAFPKIACPFLLHWGSLVFFSWQQMTFYNMFPPPKVVKVPGPATAWFGQSPKVYIFSLGLFLMWLSRHENVNNTINILQVL